MQFFEHIATAADRRTSHIQLKRFQVFDNQFREETQLFFCPAFNKSSIDLVLSADSLFPVNRIKYQVGRNSKCFVTTLYETLK